MPRTAIPSQQDDRAELSGAHVHQRRAVSDGVSDGRLQPVLDGQGQLQTASWTEAWGLQSEPYILVVKGDGTLAAKFEGVIDAEELRAALDAI